MKKSKCFKLAASLALFLTFVLTHQSFAETVQLNNGKELSGEIVAASKSEITLQMDATSVRVLYADEIKTIANIPLEEYLVKHPTPSSFNKNERWGKWSQTNLFTMQKDLTKLQENLKAATQKSEETAAFLQNLITKNKKSTLLTELADSDLETLQLRIDELSLGLEAGVGLSLPLQSFPDNEDIDEGEEGCE